MLLLEAASSLSQMETLDTESFSLHLNTAAHSATAIGTEISVQNEKKKRLTRLHISQVIQWSLGRGDSDTCEM
jgi:hypothetical protein